MSTLVDFPVKPEARPYLDAFADDAREPQWLRNARRKSLGRFAEQGFPTRRSENWRYLDLKPLEKRPLAASAAPRDAEAALLADFVLTGPTYRLVLVDARFSPVLSGLSGDLPDGVWLGSMKAAIGERSDLARSVLEDPGQPFTALNTAFFSDGFVLDVAPGIAVDRPIEIIHLAIAGGSLHTRNLINLGAGSSATIIETYAGLSGDDGRYWRNDVATWRVADGAALTRVALVEEAAEAVHLGEVAAVLGAAAKLDGFICLLGGGTVRQEASVTMAGDGATCRIDGAFLVSGREEANIVTSIDHTALGGTTTELIKGVAAGRGHGAFQGRIIVRDGAQQTDARQTSRNLILGRRAAIDTKPELEILADDVKCAHGASVGELDEAALFYLRARGIPTEEARRLLVEGFLREPLEGIAHPAIREHLLNRLSLRLARLEEWS